MTPSPVSSTPVLRTALTWGAIVAGALAVVGAVIGFAVGGGEGVASALAGVLVGAFFSAVTAASILIANRWYGDELYVPIFFGVVLGGWLVKLVLFIVALFVLRGQPWMDPMVFFVALVASVLGSLVVDAVVLMRMRIPHASDVSLPTDPDAGDRRD
jgi:drug/metabolite transporter (DMT)-like permease